MKEKEKANNCLESYFEWQSQCKKKQKGNEYIIDGNQKLITKEIHLGTMYLDDILLIVDYIESTKTSFEFRFLDKICLDSLAENLQQYDVDWEEDAISNYTFNQKLNFENRIKKSRRSLFPNWFIEFRCYGSANCPFVIGWDSKNGILKIAQAFNPKKITYIQNIIDGLTELLQSKRESFWFRNEAAIYFYALSNIICSLAFYYKSLPLGILWFSVFVILIGLFQNKTSRTFSTTRGILKKKEHDPIYIKKKKRVKFIVNPLKWITNVILGAVLLNFLKGII